MRIYFSFTNAQTKLTNENTLNHLLILMRKIGNANTLNDIDILGNAPRKTLKVKLIERVNLLLRIHRKTNEFTTVLFQQYTTILI